jgi:DNA (cytosine-5)-methyltransferase 1
VIHFDDCIVDNFAGGGGATEGIEKAVGRPVDIAINHDHEALEMHKANHPYTRHLPDNVWKVEPRRVTEGRRVGLGWFSPDCTHFSKAKGGKPVSKKIRGLAKIVTRWGKETDMNLFILENVEEFQGWGPVSKDGIPIAARKGEIFKRWWGSLEDLGYNIDMRLLRACDYGAPTSRRRLFVVGRKDGLPISWPDPTYGFETNPYRTAAECIDWSIPCPSIFTPGRNIVDNTMRRVAHGVMRYVVNNPRPFIVPDTDQAPTLIQVGYGERKGQAPRCLDLHRPLGTVVAQGNKYALVTAFLARHFGNSVGHAADVPLGTITADGGGKSALVVAHILKLKGTCRDGQPIDRPLHTVQAGGLHYAVVFAFLSKYYGTDQDPRLDLPLHTITTKDRFALVTVTVDGELYAIVDIGMRMLTPRELFRAQGFRDSYIIDPMVPCKRSKKNLKLVPLPKTGQVRMCGNSVPPDLAEAVVVANYHFESRGDIAA